MDEVTNAPCNKCGQFTRHVLLAKRAVKKMEETTRALVDWNDLYEMLECCGCESVVLHHTRWATDLAGELDESLESEDSYYPPTISRPVPKWIWRIPPELAAIMDEVYTALHSGSDRLAVMGARTVLDMAIQDKVGDIGTFREKLQALERHGFIGQSNREILSAALDAGSAAAHRGYRPRPEQVGQVMDIVENLLEALYVLTSAGDELKKLTPPRRAGNK